MNNRPIKFRAWDGIFKTMHYGIELLGEEAPTFIKMTGVPQNPCILMQFTGFLDKNGKEIYEGDIVRLPERFDGDHYYKQEVAEVKWEYDSWYIERLGECGYNHLEVIGNIFEDSALLT